MPEVFGCILPDLLAAKLCASGLSIDAAIFLYLYLKQRKPGVKINNVESLFETHLFGVPQATILSSILNIFINDLFILIAKTKLANFANGNTIYKDSKDIKTSLKILERESEMGTSQF